MSSLCPPPRLGKTRGSSFPRRRPQLTGLVRCRTIEAGMEPPPARFWIFQALPERYELATRLEPGRVDNWVVSRFADEIAAGDVVYMWQAGSEDALHGWARVNGPVFERAEPSDAAERRVELLYVARFPQPLTRREIREHPQLVDLTILTTGRGTNFRVEAAQALAINELLRSHGLDAPPDPPPAAPPPALEWRRLSPAAQQALAWAA